MGKNINTMNISHLNQYSFLSLVIMSLPNEFYVTLASDESSKYFETKYKTSSFTNKLPSPILFNEVYSVALTEIFIPPFSVHTKDDSNDISRDRREVSSLKIKLQDMNLKFSVPIEALIPNEGKVWKLNELFVLLLQSATETDIDSFLSSPLTLQRMQFKLREIINSIFIHKIGYTSLKKKGSKYFLLYVPCDQDDSGEFRYIKIDMPIKSYKTLHNFFTEMIERIPRESRDPRMLAVVYKEIASAKDYGIRVIKLIKEIFGEVADDPEFEETDDEILQTRFISSKSELRMLYIYSDIVASQIYANRMLTLLRVIPYFDTSVIRNGLHIKFDSPEFYPLSKEYFESISIIISNREDEIVFSPANKNPIYIKLLFRRM